MGTFKKEMTVLAALKAVTPETANEIANLSDAEHREMMSLANGLDKGGALVRLLTLLSPAPSVGATN